MFEHDGPLRRRAAGARRARPVGRRRARASPARSRRPCARRSASSRRSSSRSTRERRARAGRRAARARRRLARAHARRRRAARGLVAADRRRARARLGAAPGRAGRGAAALDRRRRGLLRRPLPDARRRAPARPSARDRRRRALLPLARRGAARGARRARRRAARRHAREAAAQPPADRAAARLACFAGTGTLRARRRAPATASSSASRSAAAAGRRCCRPASTSRRPRLDVAASLGLPRDQEARLRARLARIATLDEVAPGLRRRAAAGRGARPVTALIELRPRGPYHLRMTLGGVRDGTLRLRDGGAELVFATPAGPAHARVAQRSRRRRCAIALAAPDDACALDRLRFLLARRRRHRAVPRAWPRATTCCARRWRAPAGCAPRARAPACTRSCAGSPASCHVRARRGRIERAIVRRAGPRRTPACTLSPERADLARLSAAQVAASGLAPRRASALVRVSRTLDLERLADACRPRRRRAASCASASSAPGRSATFFLHGLGRYDRGLVGDLGLIKLCSALLGRRAEAEDTAELLARYGEWAGLASLHLLRAPRVDRQERAPRARTASA